MKRPPNLSAPARGGPLSVRAAVASLARESRERFEIPAELEPELRASLAEADSGESISADQVLGRLRRAS